MPQVICKATDETQKRALEKIGADRVLIPEREIGIKLAQTISSTSILDFIELSREYGIAELPTPAHWAGKTLRELNVRAKYGVNIIALKSGSKVNVSPAADAVLQADAVLVVVGTNEQLAKLKS